MTRPRSSGPWRPGPTARRPRSRSASSSARSRPGREIACNLARIEAAGAAKVVYRAVDVRDAAAVRACLGATRSELGPIRGLVHGAGVLADRRIEDQTDAQFATVYDTRVAGLRHLLAAIGTDDLRVLALFSSSTARFGRNGPGGVRDGQRGPEQVRRARGAGPPGLPRRRDQLGPLGRRHGHRRAQAPVRGRGRPLDPTPATGRDTSSPRSRSPSRAGRRSRS